MTTSLTDPCYGVVRIGPGGFRLQGCAGGGRAAGVEAQWRQQRAALQRERGPPGPLLVAKPMCKSMLRRRSKAGCLAGCVVPRTWLNPQLSTFDSQPLASAGSEPGVAERKGEWTRPCLSTELPGGARTKSFQPPCLLSGLIAAEVGPFSAKAANGQQSSTLSFDFVFMQLTLSQTYCSASKS